MLFSDYFWTEEQYNVVKNTVFVIQGAGIAELNGEYVHEAVNQSIGEHVLAVVKSNEHTVWYTIYKSKHKNSFRWNIANWSTGNGALYFCDASEEEFLPSATAVWMVVSSNPKSRSPAPVVTMKHV